MGVVHYAEKTGKARAIMHRLGIPGLYSACGSCEIGLRVEGYDDYIIGVNGTDHPNQVTCKSCQRTKVFKLDGLLLTEKERATRSKDPNSIRIAHLVNHLRRDSENSRES